MQDGKFHHFIIITIMVPFEHDPVGSTQSIERAVITRR
jgi:hypothetical protein